MSKDLGNQEWLYAQNVLQAIEAFLDTFETYAELSILRDTVKSHNEFPSGIVTQQRELFTKRQLIEPVFDALGYEGVTAEPVDLMPDERKRPDYCIEEIHPSCACIAEIKTLGLLSPNTNQPNEAEQQIITYLEENTLSKYRRDLDVESLVGIATDGLIWSLYSKPRNGGEVKKIREVNIARCFEAATRARQYDPSMIDDDWVPTERDYLQHQLTPVFAGPMIGNRIPSP